MSTPEEILYCHLRGQFLTTSSKATGVFKCWGPSCGRPQSATYNGVRHFISNWLAITPSFFLRWAAPPERNSLVQMRATNLSVRSRIERGTSNTRGSRTAYAAPKV